MLPTVCTRTKFVHTGRLDYEIFTHPIFHRHGQAMANVDIQSNKRDFVTFKIMRLLEERRYLS